ncbi:MAG TPA: LPS export ABC transporter permease LptG [Deltaproteobacteria bacterium]|nr:LPS export ABC transporter permease LptG [Deltaproteobacteria bacterium]HIJ36973.1 LPS export ABC transporter permease LptG [Deltaproteobacteria bacterium]HIJ41374.1 LPS export ABC transporter permease LptG [Deltaproteobacteria bacterium]
MNILSKYLAKEFLKLLILCQVIFISLYLMIDFTGGIDDFMKAHAPVYRMFAYYGYKIPAIFVQMLPVSTLTSVIILFCIMKRNNEVIALNGCGISLWRIAQPVMFTSLLLSLLSFFFSETIVPYASSLSNAIWRIDVKKEESNRFQGRNHVWYRGENAIYWIKRFDGVQMVMNDPTLYFFDGTFKLIRRIDGRRGIWMNDFWRINDGILQEREEGGGFSLKRFRSMDLKIPEKPEDFIMVEREPDEMGYRQLRRFADKLEQEGYNAIRYFVELHIKIAFPFINLIMALVGIPVALWKRTMGAPMAVSIGIALCFLYLLIMGLTRTLGFAGIFPPILSAWLANALFLFLGIYLMIHANR